MDNPLLDIAAMLPSWELAMRAERKAPGTIKSYTDAVKGYLRWSEHAAKPACLTKPLAQAFVADLLDGGAEANTAHSRLKGLRRFSAWLVEEGEMDDDPLLGIKPVKVDQKVVNALSGDQLKLLIKACVGKELKDRRDEALVRFMHETGARAAEVVALQVTDVELDKGRVIIQRGKGGKGRAVYIGPQTAVAIDRYLRTRRAHRLADGGSLWLGGRGRSFGYWALNAALKARAEAAGIEGFHLHLMRHTWATDWKAAGGSDDGMMAIGGWTSRSMIDRYAGAAAAGRAANEARTLALGDL